MAKGFGETRFVDERVCPWWHAYTFDNSLRRLFQKPEKILKKAELKKVLMKI